MQLLFQINLLPEAGLLTIFPNSKLICEEQNQEKLSVARHA